MIVKKEKIRISITEIIKILFSLVFLVGIRTWFSVCPVTSEMTMSCHWAGETLKAISLVLLAVSLIHMFIPDEKIKIGVDAASLCLLIMTAFTPGKVISLCQHAEMSCRSNAQPWTIVISAVMIIACVIDMIIYASALSEKKHRRKDNA